MSNVNETKRSKRGAGGSETVVTASEKRTLQITTGINLEEMKYVDEQRARVRMRRGEYLRAATFNRLPGIVPENNLKFVKEISLIGSNLNQLAKFMNGGGENENLISEVKELLYKIKKASLGIKNGDEH